MKRLLLGSELNADRVLLIKMCGQGENIDPLQREYAWYNQERLKGDMISGSGRNEGGWGFNRKYMVLGGEFVGDQGQFVEEWLPPTAYAVSQITGCTWVV